MQSVGVINRDRPPEGISADEIPTAPATPTRRSLRLPSVTIVITAVRGGSSQADHV